MADHGTTAARQSGSPLQIDGKQGTVTERTDGKATIRVATIGAVTVAAALLGWFLTHVPYSPPLPAVACDAVFATAPTIEPSGNSYRVLLHLRADPEPAVVDFQIIDSNGFGWILRDLPAGPRLAGRPARPLPHPHRPRGRAGAIEAARATAIRRAARAFDVGAWVAARGWAAPDLTLCRSFDTHG